MPTVNITTGALLSVASNLRQHAARMHNTASSIYNKLHSMESWSDPRAQQFVQQSDMICKGLKLNIDNFQKMADFLKKYAEHQERIDHEMQQRLNNAR